MSGLKVHTRESVRQRLRSSLDPETREALAKEYWRRVIGCRASIYDNLPGDYRLPPKEKP